jgi:hypothetical protein
VELDFLGVRHDDRSPRGALAETLAGQIMREQSRQTGGGSVSNSNSDPNKKRGKRRPLPPSSDTPAASRGRARGISGRAKGRGRYGGEEALLDVDRARDEIHAIFERSYGPPDPPRATRGEEEDGEEEDGEGLGELLLEGLMRAGVGMMMMMMMMSERGCEGRLISDDV